MSLIAFATSIELPPPIPMTPSHRRIAIAIKPNQNVLLGWVRLDFAVNHRLFANRTDRVPNQSVGNQARVGHYQGMGDTQPS